ncbi:hypothetical protein QQY66_48400 [Streptomyces sp. DG2A-72]|uniref:hypothetical protein n=1 Tax=Streptomyces sp. DG2A-72 TaxID=3051386 RepID=UPI00265BDE81|nr:hypothetical protein [Streptomyces sp. DG2A-72]MDO0939150.1 hypothetical protein [Streptomyces sp. DG2A-72]
MQDVTLQGTGQSRSADTATIQGLLGRLQFLEISEDEEVRERLKILGPAQRDALKKVISDTGVLEVLADATLRDHTREAVALNAEQTSALTAAARHPDLLDALHSDNVRRIALHAAGLSEPSPRPVFAMIDHLRQVEGSPDITNSISVAGHHVHSAWGFTGVQSDGPRAPTARTWKHALYTMGWCQLVLVVFGARRATWPVVTLRTS